MRDPKIAAFDLTFSAPKSVSVLFATAPERVAGVLVGCHEEAVRAALEYLQDTAVRVRRGPGGLREEQAGLIAAAYRHRMSRALDPQLHTHVVAANLARGSDGRFTSLYGRLLYRAAKTAGTLYQAHLRALVSERLGLEWGEVHKGASELVGIEAGVIEHFSQRRHEMRRAAEAEGISLNSKRGWEAAALSSRERKQYGLQTHTWREEVRARAAEHGLDTGRIQELLDEGRERIERGLAQASVMDDRAIGDLLAGPAGLTERVNTFDDLAVLQGLASATRAGARVADVRGQAVRFTERADVIPTRARRDDDRRVDRMRASPDRSRDRQGRPGHAGRRGGHDRGDDRDRRSPADRRADSGGQGGPLERRRRERDPSPRGHRKDIHRRSARELAMSALATR